MYIYIYIYGGYDRAGSGLTHSLLLTRLHSQEKKQVCLTCTYPHILRIVSELAQSLEHSLTVLLPLSFAEDDFQEVPGPANQRNLQELVLGEHF